MSDKNQRSRPPEHFEELYRAHPDPWGFTTRIYERQKYEATLRALGTRRFQRGLEVGCSIGVLTELLASHCETLVGLDFAPSAIRAARQRCAAYPAVTIEEMQVPQQWPEGQFDLIVLSEVLYFLTADDLMQACDHTRRSILPGGQVLLVNYTGPTDDPSSGDLAASSFITAAAPCLRPILQRRERHYRLDLLAAPGP